MDDEAPSRALGPLLLVGLLTTPAVFAWLLLRRGYPRSLRVTALAYTIVMTAIPLIGRTFG